MNKTTENYGELTANTIREFARGLNEHLVSSADHLVNEVRLLSERNLKEAEAIQARCHAFSDEIQRKAETIAKSNEMIFERMTRVGKSFASTMDHFADAIGSETRPQITHDVKNDALDAVEEAVLGLKKESDR